MNAAVRSTLVLAIFGIACAPAARPADTTKVSVAVARPRLLRLVPDSVRLVGGNVIEIELQGTNLDAVENTVMLGALELNHVRSAVNGTRITVAIPDAVPSGAEAPPARWIGGRYPVSIRTVAGTSDTLLLVISTAGSMP